MQRDERESMKMPKPISVTEAGRRGGKATAAKLTPAQRKAAWRHAASKPRPEGVRQYK